MEQISKIEPVPTLIGRGIGGLCPRCGKGRLFKSYLKPNEFCAVCAENLARYRADDGPAWLTILITAHIIVPVAIYFSMHDILPESVAFPLMLVLTIALALLILPRTKGVFICMLWGLAEKKRRAAR